MVKIIDCFIFYNELDLLEYRLATLYNFVDSFILVESGYTFSGKEKILFYNENKERYAKYANKIVHVILQDATYKYPNIDYSKNEQWINERDHRNCISNGIDYLKLDDTDVIIITDLDEITDNQFLLNIKNGNININDVFSMAFDFYYYNLNTYINSEWYHPKILNYGTYKHLNYTPEQLRLMNALIITPHCGWHLSYFGDKQFIKNKLQHFAHQEYNNETYTDVNKIDECIKTQTNLFDSKRFTYIPIEENTYLPHEWNKYLTQYILYEK
jgi:beta-1,4-mannosyl-glycoprotein beta-1,4-N-acetylglucosaminyltransferase